MIIMGSQRLKSPLRKAIAVGLTAAAVAGGGASISGCGSSATVDPVASAADLSSREAGIRFALQVKLTPSGLSQLAPGLSRSISITAHGYVDQPERAARTSIDFAGVPQMSALPGGGSGMEVVFIYPTLYMRMPFLADKLPEGKSWMKVDMAKLIRAGGGSIPQALSLGQADPTQFLQYLRASSGQIRRLGSQQLDGVPTVRYRTTLQLSSLLARLPLADRAAAATMLSHAGGSGSVPIDVWIDQQRRVRRVQMSLKLAGGAVNGPATIAIDFTSYEPVPTIHPPKESEVVDLTGLVPSIGASAGLGTSGR